MSDPVPTTLGISLPPTSVLKIRDACIPCRKQRSKCDGQPSCARCVHLDLECTYVELVRAPTLVPKEPWQEFLNTTGAKPDILEGPPLDLIKDSTSPLVDASTFPWQRTNTNRRRRQKSKKCTCPDPPTSSDPAGQDSSDPQTSSASTSSSQGQDMTSMDLSITNGDMNAAISSDSATINNTSRRKGRSTTGPCRVHITEPATKSSRSITPSHSSSALHSNGGSGSVSHTSSSSSSLRHRPLPPSEPAQLPSSVIETSEKINSLSAKLSRLYVFPDTHTPKAPPPPELEILQSRSHSPILQSHLIQLYISHCLPTQPILDPPTFMAQLAAQDYCTPPHPLIVAAMCASAARCLDDADVERLWAEQDPPLPNPMYSNFANGESNVRSTRDIIWSIGEYFAVLAKGYLRTELPLVQSPDRSGGMGDPLTVVQGLIMITTWDASVGRQRECQACAALALRIMIAGGWHLMDHPNGDGCTDSKIRMWGTLERELARRCWWVVWSTEKWMAAILTQYVTLHLSLCETLSLPREIRLNDENDRRSVLFFQQMIQSAYLCGSIIQLHYHPFESEDGTDYNHEASVHDVQLLEARLLEIDEHLEAFYKAIPLEFKPDWGQSPTDDGDNTTAYEPGGSSQFFHEGGDWWWRHASGSLIEMSYLALKLLLHHPQHVESKVPSPISQLTLAQYANKITLACERVWQYPSTRPSFYHVGGAMLWLAICYQQENTLSENPRIRTPACVNMQKSYFLVKKAGRLVHSNEDEPLVELEDTSTAPSTSNAPSNVPFMKPTDEQRVKPMLAVFKEMFPIFRQTLRDKGFGLRTRPNATARISSSMIIQSPHNSAIGNIPACAELIGPSGAASMNTAHVTAGSSPGPSSFYLAPLTPPGTSNTSATSPMTESLGSDPSPSPPPSLTPGVCASTSIPTTDASHMYGCIDPNTQHLSNELDFLKLFSSSSKTPVIMGRDDSYDNQFDNGGYRESSFSNRPPRHQDQYQGYNNRHGTNNSPPPRINHNNTNPSQQQRNNDGAPRRPLDNQWANQERGWRPPTRDDLDRSRAKRPRTFSTDSNGERNDVDRRGSPPHHFQHARKTPHPQDDIHGGPRKNFHNNKHPQPSHYQQHHGFNNNNNTTSNSNHHPDSRQRPDSSEPRRNHSFDEKWNREGGGNFGHGQRASVGNAGGSGYNHNNNTNNNNSRYRNNNFPGDHDDKFHGANRGRHFNSSPKRSTSPNHFYRGNRFKSPTPDRRSPRDDSRNSQFPPGRRRSQSRGHRDDREGDGYGYRHGSNSSNDQDTSFGKRRRSPSLNTLENRESHVKNEHNPYPFPPPPPPPPPQEFNGAEWGKALYQGLASKEYAEYPTGVPTGVPPNPPIPPTPPIPIPPPVLTGGQIPDLANVLPLLMQLQQQQQLSLQQPQFPNVIGMAPPFAFPFPPPPPPPIPPTPPTPPVIGGAGIVPEALSDTQYKIASAMIPLATHTTMTTTADNTSANSAKENEKSQALKENHSQSTTEVLGNSGSAVAINNSIKKEPDDEQGDTVYFLPRSRDQRNNQMKTSNGSPTFESKTSVPNSKVTEEAAVQEESSNTTSQQPPLPPHMATVPLPPATDALSAILSDPLTARLLETIQPFLSQKPSSSNVLPNTEAKLKDDSVSNSVQSTAQDTLKSSDAEILSKLDNEIAAVDAQGNDAKSTSTSVSEKRASHDGFATNEKTNQDHSKDIKQDQQQLVEGREGNEENLDERLVNLQTSGDNGNLAEGARSQESASRSMLQATSDHGASGDVLSAIKPSDRLRLSAKLQDMASPSDDSDMDISSDEGEANSSVANQAKSVNAQKDVPVVESDGSIAGSAPKDGAEPKEMHDKSEGGFLLRKRSSEDSRDSSEPAVDMNDMDVDKPQMVSIAPIKPLDTKFTGKIDQQESVDADRVLKRRQRSCSSPSLSSQTIAKAKLGHHHQQHAHSSWHSVPGSDMAILSEMAASTADLNRFRRESVWLEDRLRRPRADAESEEVLDKALGLTRNIPYPNQENGAQNSGGGDGNNSRDSTNSAVRLSSESRVAFSMLKTNLMSDLEEQTRLETDYQTLQRALERMQVKIVEKQQLQKEAEQQIKEVASRQSELEAELQKLREKEEECIRQRELQRKQAADEIQKLHATLLSLQQQGQHIQT
ncbi:hypothetical protein BGZ76_007486 [Entomortierella beljakovae]|nr:hypothetical protein BGZ76_007486 [Entomortierella beljakovae]